MMPIVIRGEGEKTSRRGTDMLVRLIAAAVFASLALVCGGAAVAQSSAADVEQQALCSVRPG